MTLHRLALAALLALTPLPAQALSCVPHEVTDTYQRLDRAEAAYVVVHGTLTFDQALVPQTDWDDQAGTPPNTYIPATITGNSLSKSGFDRPFSAPLTLNLQCIGPWCVGATSGQDMLAFLERKPDGRYALTLHSCGGDGFASPSTAQLQQAKTCFVGGPCAAKYPN